MSSNQILIDTHTHIFPQKLASRAVSNIGGYYTINMHCDGTSEGLLTNTAALPNVRFIISSATLKLESMIHGNDYLLAEAQAHADRFIPFTSFYPFLAPKDAEAEIDRCVKAGSRGIKLHPDFQHFNIDDPNAVEIYRICAERGLPILFHVGDENTDFSTPTRMARVADKLPQLKIIAAHMCGYKAWDEAEHVLIGANVWTETSDALMCLPAERVLHLIRRHGVKKTMFGSDFPLRSTEEAYNNLNALPLTDEEKQQIFHKTAEDLLGL